MEPQFVGINVDLILANVTADRSNLADALDRLQFILDDEVLHASQFVQSHATFGRLKHVVVDLTEPRRIGSQLRNHTLGQLGCGGPELFGHPAAGPVEIDRVLERDLHKAVTEHAFAADRIRTRNGQQRNAERIRHLIFDIFGRTSRPRRQHNDLVLADVRNRIDRHRLESEPTPDAHADREQHHQQWFFYAETDDEIQHRY